MLWSSVPQLRWLVLRQVLASWFFLGSMIALFWYQPAIVSSGTSCCWHRLVPGPYEERALGNYFAYGWWSLLIAWGTLEVGGFTMLWRYKAKPDEYPDTGAAAQSRQQAARQAADARHPARHGAHPRRGGDTKLPVGTQGDHHRRHRRDAYPAGDDLCQRARGKPPQAPRRGAGGADRRGQQRDCHPEVGAADVGGLRPLRHGWREAVFLILAWVVLSLTHMLYKLWRQHIPERAIPGRCRRREARGLGWPRGPGDRARPHPPHRYGLAAVQDLPPARQLAVRTHPGISDRAEALELNPRELADGNVQIGDVVVAA